jgi:polysaccharide biosynthesis transport protein
MNEDFMGKTKIAKPADYDVPELTLRDMLRPLFRHRWAVSVTFTSIFVASVVLAWGWANRYYVATMQVVVDRTRLDPAVTAQPTAALQETNKTVTTEDVDSEVALLQGRDMLREVAQTCKLAEERFSFWGSKNDHDQDLRKATALEGATRALAGSIKVEAQKTSRVINVGYGSTRSPETTACVLQTLAKLYLQKHLRLQHPAGALDFFAQETNKYQRALAESESQLVEFSKTEGIAAPEVLRTNLAQELIAAQTNLNQTHQAIAGDQQRIENIKAQMAATPSRSATAEAAISANLLLDNLHSTLLAAQLKRTQLLLKYDSSYPLVKEVETEIAQTTEAIAAAEKAKYINTTTDRDPTFEYLRQDQAKTEADLASDKARAAALQTSIRDINVQMVSLEAKTVEQAALVRQAKANEANYLLYLTKREQERASDALDDKRIANVAIAVPPNVPVLPARSPFAVMFTGFFIAVLAAIAAGYVAELVDQSFRTPTEVEGTLNIPILAAVPKKCA